ncbi:MAG: 4Fe-4S double cluster binding domain-containing protein [Candidatus Helarchaeota archaeon]
MSWDMNFRRKVLDKHQDINLQYCYQCSRCVRECPVSAIVGDDVYNPRRIILNAFLGLKDAVIKSKDDNVNLYACTYCDTCDEVCPSNIELTEIFYLLKNISLAENKGPEWPIAQAKVIYENGLAIPMQAAIEKRRERMGLSGLPAPDVSDIQTILKETGVAELLK